MSSEKVTMQEVEKIEETPRHVHHNEAGHPHHVQHGEGRLHPELPGPEWLCDFEDKREWLRPYFAEGVATLIYVLFGCSAVAAFALTGGKEGSWEIISLCFGFGITFAIYLSAPISGGHTSPAITVVFAVFRGFPWRKVPGYCLSQLIGAFIASGLVYLTYYPLIQVVDPEHTITLPTSTSVIWAGVGEPYISTGYGAWIEFIGSASFTFLVMNIIDPKNVIVSPGVAPILIGLVIAVVAMCFGPMGITLNPARDLGPRLFATIIYGPQMFTLGNSFFWIPLVMTFVGCLFGAFLYDLLFQVHDRPGKEVKEDYYHINGSK